jgi:hypothetical protein
MLVLKLPETAGLQQEYLPPATIHIYVLGDVLELGFIIILYVL